MAVEIAGIRLDRIHRVSTVERATFVSHRIPGLEGNVAQEMGRDSVRLQIEGIFYGAGAREAVDELRQAHKARQAVDFLAEITGQAYFAQVVLEEFRVTQEAGEPDQLSYVLIVSEFVAPPVTASSAASAGLSAVDADIALAAQQFMDIATLPDLLGSIPEVTNPLTPLSSALAEVQTATADVGSVTAGLKAVFGVG